MRLPSSRMGRKSSEHFSFGPLQDLQSRSYFFLGRTYRANPQLQQHSGDNHQQGRPQLAIFFRGGGGKKRRGAGISTTVVLV